RLPRPGLVADRSLGRRQHAELGVRCAVAGVRRVRGVHLVAGDPPRPGSRGTRADPKGRGRPGPPPGRHRPAGTGRRRPRRSRAGCVEPLPGLAERQPGRATSGLSRLPGPAHSEGEDVGAALKRYRVMAYVVGVALVLLVVVGMPLKYLADQPQV